MVSQKEREAIRASIAAQSKRLDQGKREFRKWPVRKGARRSVARHLQSAA